MKIAKIILLSSVFMLSALPMTACGGDGYQLPTPKPPVVVDPPDDEYPEGEYFADLPTDCDPETIGRNIAEHFIVTRRSNWGNVHSDSWPNHITYPDVYAWLGALWFAEESGNDELWNRLADKFDRLFDDEKNLQPALFPSDGNKVDFYVFGAIPLHIYQRRKEQKYLDLGLKYADGQYSISGNYNYSASQIDWHNRGYSWQTRLWIDDMYMITALQMQAFLATGDAKYMKRAADGMVLYLDRLQKGNGLFYHADNAQFYWARGNGWMAVGMTEVLRLMPKTAEYAGYRTRIEQGYNKMMAGLLQNQAADGMWCQLIDRKDRGDMWKETSGSAMFAYAFIEGVKNGWLDGEAYGPAAREAWIALETYLDDQYEIREVCEGTGTGNSYEYYRDRRRWVGDTHGQAGMLWCARALLDATEID